MDMEEKILGETEKQTSQVEEMGGWEGRKERERHRGGGGWEDGREGETNAWVNVRKER